MLKSATTGVAGLDEVLQGLRLGDNVVWQIDHVEDYRNFIRPFVARALEDKKTILYMRFAKHAPLLTEPGIQLCQLDAYQGFETFTREIHRIITRAGHGAFYVFDCLSDLLSAWATDQMIGNFFMVTCPYLFELDTIAYFSIERGRHSSKTVARIRETTQLLLDVYNCDGNNYLHPLKVWNRYSPTMFLPHMQQGPLWLPITSSMDTSRLFTHICTTSLENTRRQLDYWDLLFLEVEEMVRTRTPPGQRGKMLDRLCRLILGNEDRMLSLCLQYFTLEDFLALKSRLIGTGFVGGKAAGMLLARNILLSEQASAWDNFFEPHDSFFIGSDVYYSYIVQNGFWKTWMEQKTPEGYFAASKPLQKKLLAGKFPDEITDAFQRVIEYFGQSPIIVRSSSLLEDSFGNAFAGKYESLFLVNQGTPEERFDRFLEAVQNIYASTMNEDALIYRQQRGLDQADEQMALLVQRVSGSYRQKYFFPFCAGVGVSYNTFVWNKELSPQAGMLRLVFGLGTRAVNRTEGDYSRIVALDAPHLRVFTALKEAREFTQREVDVLDVENNAPLTLPLSRLTDEVPDLPLPLIGIRDHELTARLQAQGGKNTEAWILTFDALLSRPPFLSLMQDMLKTLEKVYHYPVDVEFTVNFTQDDQLKLNLLQCRPLQTKGLGANVTIPDTIMPEQVVFSSEGNFAGGNLAQPIRRVITVDPEGYTGLTISEKYTIARLVGKLNRLIPSAEEMPTLLLGPGRWGTSTPTLGIPVSFSEINRITVLGEMAFASGNLMPELSFGTHFFQDLVETGIFYLALYPELPGVVFRLDRLARLPNRLPELLPEHAQVASVIGVYDTAETGLQVLADIVSQKLVCFMSESGP
ncbi:PEP/pyruvate-binding domain-containing protein [candidate division FCPU426 bacterium]|nr:PEP/pyruvate-binding domain-containing protein [candidate division FCPU426 bacterium]